MLIRTGRERDGSGATVRFDGGGTVVLNLQLNAHGLSSEQTNLGLRDSPDNRGPATLRDSDRGGVAYRDGERGSEESGGELKGVTRGGTTGGVIDLEEPVRALVILRQLAREDGEDALARGAHEVLREGGTAGTTSGLVDGNAMIQSRRIIETSGYERGDFGIIDDAETIGFVDLPDVVGANGGVEAFNGNSVDANGLLISVTSRDVILEGQSLGRGRENRHVSHKSGASEAENTVVAVRETSAGAGGSNRAGASGQKVVIEGNGSSSFLEIGDVNLDDLGRRVASLGRELKRVVLIVFILHSLAHKRDSGALSGTATLHGLESLHLLVNVLNGDESGEGNGIVTVEGAGGKDSQVHLTLAKVAEVHLHLALASDTSGAGVRGVVTVASGRTINRDGISGRVGGEEDFDLVTWAIGKGRFVTEVKNLCFEDAIGVSYTSDHAARDVELVGEDLTLIHAESVTLLKREVVRTSRDDGVLKSRLDSVTRGICVEKLTRSANREVVHASTKTARVDKVDGFLLINDAIDRAVAASVHVVHAGVASSTVEGGIVDVELHLSVVINFVTVIKEDFNEEILLLRIRRGHGEGVVLVHVLLQALGDSNTTREGFRSLIDELELDGIDSVSISINNASCGASRERDGGDVRGGLGVGAEKTVLRDGAVAIILIIRDAGVDLVVLTTSNDRIGRVEGKEGGGDEAGGVGDSLDNQTLGEEG